MLTYADVTYRSRCVYTLHKSCRQLPQYLRALAALLALLTALLTALLAALLALLTAVRVYAADNRDGAVCVDTGDVC
jgi:ABC-type lipoprotein release transport system permease subunit